MGGRWELIDNQQMVGLHHVINLRLAFCLPGFCLPFYDVGCDGKGF